MTEVRAVYWDLGGVLLRTMDRSPRRDWEHRLGLAKGELDEVVFGCTASRKATLGQGSSESIWQEVQARFQLSPQQARALANDFFAEDRLDPVLLDVLRQLRPFYRIGMITNAWPEVREILEDKLRISSYFDSVITSAEVGFAKPHPHIYRLALLSLGMAPEQAVFVDDFVENVEGARALGMRAVRFDSPEQALSELAQHLA